jgi:hypothetical protein
MSFFGDFFGTTQRKDLQNSNSQATTALGTGYQDASGKYEQGKGYFDPYAQSGQQANSTYADSLGLNGEAGGQNALMSYQAGRNPYLSYEQDMAQRGLDRAANARGRLNSGASMMAASRARQEMGYKDYGGWQNQLMGMGRQGMQAAGAQSALTQGQGDLRSGYGQQTAANAINYGNAQAASRSTGINNLISVASLAAKASGVGGFAPPGKG